MFNQTKKSKQLKHKQGFPELLCWCQALQKICVQSQCICLSCMQWLRIAPVYRAKKHEKEAADVPHTTIEVETLLPSHTDEKTADEKTTDLSLSHHSLHKWTPHFNLKIEALAYQHLNRSSQQSKLPSLIYQIIVRLPPPMIDEILDYIYPNSIEFRILRSHSLAFDAMQHLSIDKRPHPSDLGVFIDGTSIAALYESEYNKFLSHFPSPYINTPDFFPGRPTKLMPQAGELSTRSNNVIMDRSNNTPKSAMTHPISSNFDFWKWTGLHSRNGDFGVSLIIKNDTNCDIHLIWVAYDGSESNNGLVHPQSATVVGTYVSHVFALRVALPYSQNNRRNNKYRLMRKNLSIIAVYQIRSTYPTHIIHVYSLNKPISISAGSPIRKSAPFRKVYRRCIIAGFKVHFEPDIFRTYPTLHRKLTKDLQYITQRLPKSALKVLFRIHIWVNESCVIGHCDSPTEAHGIAFHHDPRWMIGNAVMIEKCLSIEIFNATDYLEYRRCQPYVLLHEFSHAYHHWIGRERIDIIKVYNDAMSNGLYEKVYKVDRMVWDERNRKWVKNFILCRGYATTNHYEYFAEISEAYFGQCNFYPFVRQQLKSYDSNGYALCKKLWFLNDRKIAIEHRRAPKFRET